MSKRQEVTAVRVSNVAKVLADVKTYTLQTVGLAKGVKGQAGPGRGTRGTKKEPRVGAPPTLAALGLDKKTIGAVIDAYGKGEITLEAVPKDTRRDRVYVVADASTYTCVSVAKFLGWVQKDGEPTRACRIAFEAWHAHLEAGVDTPLADDGNAR